MDAQRLLHKAVDVFRNVPAASLGQDGPFTPREAMEFVGINKDLAATPTFLGQFTLLLEQRNHTEGPPQFPSTDEDLARRAIALIRSLKCGPSGIYNRAEIIRLAGCPKEDSGPGALYMRVSRRVKKIVAQADAQVGSQNEQRRSNQPPIPNVQAAFEYIPSEGLALLSPLTESSVSTFDSTYNETSLLTQEPAEASQTQRSRLAPSVIRPRPTLETVTARDLNNSKSTRQTPHQRQAERLNQQQQEDIRKLAFKLGTITYDEVICGGEGHLLTRLNTADKVADGVNQLLGVDVVSGRQLKNAVNQRCIGVTPPRRGRPTTIPRNHLEDLAELFFTLSAIEEANAGPNRMLRPELSSLLGAIVNAKLKADGSNELDEVPLYEQIQRINSRRQDIEQLDPRQALRVQWMTSRTLTKYFINWEKEMVKLGFARMPLNEREKAEKGHVVFYDGQLRRYVNVDEMRLDLSGGASKDSIGGRPAMVPTDRSQTGRTGIPSEHSSQSVTLLMGIVGDEAMPYLCIIPTAAKPENRRLHARNYAGFRYVTGQFGHETQQYFLPEMAASPKGSMTTDIWKTFMLKMVDYLWPDVQDVPGKRVIIRADSGPGRSGDAVLQQLRVQGAYYRPGCPNTTECSQEMDQLFSACKTAINKNKNELWRARHEAVGAKATITFRDVGYLVQGGIVKIVDDNGELVEELLLKDALTEHLSPEKIRRAREKVGCFPATRAALKSPQVRHEVVEGDDELGEQEQIDPMGQILDRIEQRNHSVANRLIELGYEQAEKGKRFVTRATLDQVHGSVNTRTLPETRARQDALMKVSTAGQFFAVTQGGECMNSSDFLLASERKSMAVEATEQSKRKAKMEAFHSQTVPAARKAYKTKYSAWTKEDFKAAISFRRGPFPSDPAPALGSLSKAQLKAMYDEMYKGNRPDRMWEEWTEADEKNLDRLIAGEVTSLQETVIYGRALEAQNESLRTRLKVCSRSRRRSILKGLVEDVFDEEERCYFRRLLDNDEASSSSSSSGDNSIMSDSSAQDSLHSFVTMFSMANDDSNSNGSTRSLEHAALTLESQEDGDLLSASSNKEDSSSDGSSLEHGARALTLERQDDDDLSSASSNNDSDQRSIILDHIELGLRDGSENGVGFDVGPHLLTAANDVWEKFVEQHGGAPTILFSSIPRDQEGVELLCNELAARGVQLTGKETMKVNALCRRLKTTIGDNARIASFQPISRQMMWFGLESTLSNS